MQKKEVKRVLEILIDVNKSITAGLFIASLVGILIQEKHSGWILFAGFVVSLFILLFFVILYERRYNSND